MLIKQTNKQIYLCYTAVIKTVPYLIFIRSDDCIVVSTTVSTLMIDNGIKIISRPIILQRKIIF